MSRFKIEKGVSRVRRVKLQASIEESTAEDLAAMSEWSNNDRNYVVNELLRFAIAQDADFQAFKQSRIGNTADPQSKHSTALHAPDATSSKKADATEVRSANPRSE
jgi:hypothetical protein